jgi:Mn-dependent DtxR family transcriptional regulator
MNNPSQKQIDVLGAISRYIKMMGESPTYIELAVELDWEYPQTVGQYLRRLQKDGLIDRKPNSKRGVSLTERAKNILRGDNDSN